MESLIAIAIVAIVGIAAYQGLQTIIRSSAQHKESAVAETLLRSAAERLQDPGSDYLPLAGCPSKATYVPATEPGYTITVQVVFWEPPDPTVPPPYATTFSAPGACPVDDPGLQSVKLTVTSPGDFTEDLTVLKGQKR